jgi:magnesium-transporting ATPase (P-type)
MEKDAGLSYMGCMGLEDQLQLLVPESIADYLRAGIRVWMITGDKLETAKNIGIACNLIDPDMSPSFKAGQSIEDAVKATQNARLLEITGHWSKLKSNEEGMLFSRKHSDAKVYVLTCNRNGGFVQLV